MKFLLFIFTVGYLIYFPLKVNSQNSLVKIPLGLEDQPSGKDSFIPYYQLKRPRIALALSGGGARGIAQIGVLKIFEKHGIPIDGIAGTSMGAIIGGLFSVGYTATQLEEIIYKIKWNEIIQDTPPRKHLFLSQKEEKDRYILQLRLNGLSLNIPSALTAGQNLTTMITEFIFNAPHSLSTDFDNLHIPFRAVATDLLSGEKIILKQGSLIDALRASMAIPLLFTPVFINNEMLVDGGLVENLPVSEARSLGADLVIAIDTSSKLRDQKSLKAPWEIADQVTTIMQQERTYHQLKSADVSIQPLLSGISNTDFNKIEEIIQSGENAAENVIGQIKNLLTQDLESQIENSILVKKINLYGCQKLNPKIFKSLTDNDTTLIISFAKIIHSGQALIQTGDFKTVSVFFDTSNNQLTFQLVENPLIKKIVFSGNTVFCDSVLLATIESHSGEILNIQKGQKDLKQLIKKYHISGYTLARIDTVSFNNGILQIKINEGRINDIKIIGNNSTRNFVILREIPLKQGDLLNVSLLKQGIENVYSTGYFSGVRFDIQEKESSYNLIIHLVEQGYTLVRMGMRYDLERRTQGFLQIVEDNLFGFGGKGFLTGLLGKRDGMISACLRADRLFNTFLTYKLNLSFQKSNFHYYENHRQIGNYNKSTLEGYLTLGQQMRRLGTLSVQVRSEKIDIKPTVEETTPQEKFALRNITIRSEVDTRDRLPFPWTGKYHILEYETSNRFFGSKVSYFKIYSSMESYYPLFHSFTFHPKICWGTSDMTTPFAKKFRLGGLDSFLGLPEESLIGKRFVLFNGEFCYRIPWPHWLESYLSIRYDFGGIWDKYTKISTKDFKQGIGIIFSFNTPLGPVQIGYGHMSDGINHSYFSAGYKF